MLQLAPYPSGMHIVEIELNEVNNVIKASIDIIGIMVEYLVKKMQEML